ncbi:hypothetical protein HK102_008947, partial [Quaeritorhiza haematococci]
MTEPVTSIHIRATEIKDKPSRHVSYQLSIYGPVRSWTLWKRYSEFDALHQALLKLSPGNPPPLALPPKTFSAASVLLPFSMGGSAFDPVKIEERRRGLEKYLEAILHARDARWRKSREWADFLGLPETAR